MSTDVPDQEQHPQPERAITFLLSTRLMISGSIAIVLHLYRGHSLTRMSTLMVCERLAAPRVLQTCRLHLRKLGIAEGDRPGPRPTAPAFEPMPDYVPDRRKRVLRLPAAASL